ncbi:hypothetical protein BG261_08260 [Floricoccus tropicus]|uniref:Phosphoribosyltransferase domain-containing protein n=1 Tax=Floricoccus tropicus TaxID=1859473 RepID=A0A1E8GJA9_9LACT|nr:ComF family protein [Floricoccus tropicus]OFI48267.1 hypothetical protein BG261_08260 [Floricoccus tropicus]
MTCILCSKFINYQLKFTDIIFLRKIENRVCQKCLASFTKISDVHCKRCFKSGTKETCSDCKNWLKKGEEVKHQAIYKYDEAMREYFKMYKFVGHYQLRQVFAQEIKKVINTYKSYTVIPIPVSPERLEERGFCQVTAILEWCDIPYIQVFTKKDSEDQSRKNKVDRLEIEGLFSIVEGYELPTKVLLFDDIYTTGATINQARQILKKEGIKEIKSLSIAR